MDEPFNDIGKTTPNNNIMPFCSFRNLCSIGKGITFFSGGKGESGHFRTSFQNSNIGVFGRCEKSNED